MDMVEMPNNREVVLRNNADTKLNKKFTFDQAFGPESKQVSEAALYSAKARQVSSNGRVARVFLSGSTKHPLPIKPNPRNPLN